LKTFKRKFDNLYSENFTERNDASSKKEDDLVVVKVVPSNINPINQFNSAKSFCKEKTDISSTVKTIMNALQQYDNTQKAVNLTSLDLWYLKNTPPPLAPQK
jgi:hypothetical protein